MTSPGPRGPYAKGRERRREILRVALEAYAQAGPRGVSLKEIASRAGVTEAGLLHHFGSKEALLSEVLTARDAAGAEMFGADLDADHLRALVRYNTTTPGLVRLFVDVVAAASRPDHPAHDEFRDRYRALRTTGEAAFERQLAEAALALETEDATEDATDDATDDAADAAELDDPAWISRVIFAAMDGLQVQWLLDDDVDMAADVARLHAALLAVGARSRRRRSRPADPA